MTSEEQDVYAEMGVSPLEKLDREVKNPKSLIINVTLPGQQTDFPEEEIFSVVEVSSPSTTTIPTKKVVLDKSQSELSSEIPGDKEQQALALVTDENTSTSSSALKRRVRRRSSAKDID